jgi:D-glycero-alpha-D-manno-heptose-7-phosphate kinase
VLSTTIDKYVYITAVFAGQPTITIHAYDLNRSATISIGTYSYTGEFKLFEVVFKYFNLNDGCDIHVYSDLPAGSGMGTSSSLMVGLIGLFAQYFNQTLNRQQIAEIACKLEREELQETGGYQDQFAATFGGMNFITFRENVTVHPIPLNSPYREELLTRFILCYTGKTHISAHIQRSMLQNYEQLSFQEGMQELKTCAAELRGLVEAAHMDSIDKFGEILHRAWLAKKRLSNKISTNEIETLYLHALDHGALGGKLLGAGGGGFLLLFCKSLNRLELIHEMQKIGAEIVPFHFDSTGLTTWQVS